MARIAATAGLITLALSVGAAWTFASTAPPTKRVHFRVFSASGTVVGIHVVRTIKGSCWTGSIGLQRPDAWRCMTANNEILDPCLRSPKGASVPLICITGKTAVRLKLTKPLPLKMGNPPEKRFFPWRLLLSNGDLCERFTGTAAGEVQGQGLVFGCRSGGTTTYPNTSMPAWTVRYLPKGTSPSKVKKLAALKLFTVTQGIS
jgi:hypothetical protein